MKHFLKVFCISIFLILIGIGLSFLLILKSQNYKNEKDLTLQKGDMRNTPCITGDSNFQAAFKIVTDFENDKTEEPAFNLINS